MKIHVCHCLQCKAVKRKRKNRNLRKTIKRSLNKKRRKELIDSKHYTFYWA